MTEVLHERQHVSMKHAPRRRVSKPKRGVPSIGHKTHLRVFIDPDLLQYDLILEYVWAAAGTWNDVFGIEPHKLVEASGGVVIDLKRV
jgi:prolyl-tRNA editing enzyme YbaK/EbsC (Cys-tRNA(Pro) deacylase)